MLLKVKLRFDNEEEGVACAGRNGMLCRAMAADSLGP
jgi:hypothetical protein